VITRVVRTAARVLRRSGHVRLPTARAARFAPSVAAGVVTIGVSATVRVSDKDAYVRAVRVAVKSAFDRARAEDAAMDFRPPLVTPPGEAG